MGDNATVLFYNVLIIGQKIAKVVNPRKDTCSREVLRHEVRGIMAGSEAWLL